MVEEDTHSSFCKQFYKQLKFLEKGETGISSYFKAYESWKFIQSLRASA